MTFVNEYISNENIEKYKIQEIWDRYHPFGKNDVNLSYRHSWTIDRENEVFFIPALTGKEEFSNQVYCIFWWRGEELKVTLQKNGLQNNSGVRWNLKSIKISENIFESDEEFIASLKRALEAYGYRGIWRQLNEYKIEFGF